MAARKRPTSPAKNRAPSRTKLTPRGGKSAPPRKPTKSPGAAIAAEFVDGVTYVQKQIREIPNFPQPGVLFKDITPLLADGAAFQNMVEAFKARYQGKGIDQVVGIEARGFVFAAPLAYALGAGVTLVRKPDKLPHKTYKQTYALEYGTDALEIHQDALKPGQKILVIDDVLATGGTLAATALLIRTYFPEVEFHEAAFLMELGFLNGREKLGGLPVFSLLQY